MKKVSAIAVLLFGSGCARVVPLEDQMHWTKPGSTKDQLDKDVDECKNKAFNVGIPFINPANELWDQTGYMDIPLYKQCMVSRGYTQLDGP
jgi:hypothetical protein